MPSVSGDTDGQMAEQPNSPSPGPGPKSGAAPKPGAAPKTRAAPTPGGPSTPARSARSRHRSAVDKVRDVSFPIVLRGYERAAVDAYVAEVSQLVAELEATQLRESIVQRALDEVGEQTSGILQRAHETAGEIAAQSRSQAEGRLQRAESEAEVIRREAEKEAEHVRLDTRRLWETRKRLIEEMRQFADETLGVADDALDRLREPPPEEPEDGPAEEAAAASSEPPAPGPDGASEPEPGPEPEEEQPTREVPRPAAGEGPGPQQVPGA
jgi:DivIVA domain-containing protein